MKTKYLLLITVLFFVLAAVSTMLYIFEAAMPGNYNIVGTAKLYGVAMQIFTIGFVIAFILTIIEFLGKKSISFLKYTCVFLIVTCVAFYFLSQWEEQHLYTDIFAFLKRMAFGSLCIAVFVTGYRALKKSN